jgi:hypothetical protein
MPLGAGSAVQRVQVRQHLAEIADEEMPADEPAREALAEAWEQFEDAASAYAIRVRRWHELARYGGIQPEDIPPVPTQGDDAQVRVRFASGIEPPTPRSLLQPIEVVAE